MGGRQVFDAVMRQLPLGTAVAHPNRVAHKARTLPTVGLKDGPPAKPLKVVSGRRYVHPGQVISNLSRKDLEGVRVTLINMPLREAAPPNNAPLGPAILAGVLREWGAAPSIIDLNAYRIRDEDAARRGLPNGRHLNPEEVAALIAHLCSAAAEYITGSSYVIDGGLLLMAAERNSD